MPEVNKPIRILAGPNGSGKSTIIKKLRSRYYCGYFVNADEIHYLLGTKRVLNLNAEYGLNVELEEFSWFLANEGRSWIDKAVAEGRPINLTFSENNLLIAKDCRIGVYDAAIAADFVRQKLLAQSNTFTIETVLSHASKIQFLQKAKELGYKTTFILPAP
jgi:predicted ABC-type ATPase